MFCKLIKNKMNKDITKYLLFFVIFLLMKGEGKIFDESIPFIGDNNNNTNPEITLKVKQTIMEHASYYSNDNVTNKTNTDINRSFIDFSTYRFYYIDMRKVNPNIIAELMFELFF